MPQNWSDLARRRGRPDVADENDRAACRAAIRTGSRSFYAASLLLPSELRDPAYALYAFCRLSDDAVDAGEMGRGARMAAVWRLRDRLERAYDGQPYDAPADRALADTVATYDIPIALPMALLEGLAWDAEGRRYETLSELRDYAARVAGAVGAMMAALMGARSPELVARACDLGVAMQLTNIARDVGEDARAGRIYLPLDWLRRAGVDPEAFLANPQPDTPIRQVIAELLDEADALYRRAEPGIAALPRRCRPAIWAARRIYAEIGEEVMRRGCDSITGRAVVSKGRKLELAARSFGAAMFHGVCDRAAPALPEVRFLVDAFSPPPQPEPARPAWWAMGDRIARVIDLIMVLDAREMDSQARSVEVRGGPR